MEGGSNELQSESKSHPVLVALSDEAASILCDLEPSFIPFPRCGAFSAAEEDTGWC